MKRKPNSLGHVYRCLLNEHQTMECKFNKALVIFSRATVGYAYFWVTRHLISFSTFRKWHIGDLFQTGKHGDIYQVTRVATIVMPEANEYLLKRLPYFTRIDAINIETKETVDILWEWNKNIRKVKNWSTIKNSLFRWWRWYRANWLSLDVMNFAKKEPISSVNILGKRAAHGQDIY